MESAQPAKRSEPFTAYFDEVEIGPKETVFVRHRRDENWDKQALFRADQFVARESISGATGVVFAFVGNKLQNPVPDSIAGIPSLRFSPSPLLSGICWDTCDHALRMTVVVHNRFDQPVKWSAEARGKAVPR